MNKPKKEIIHGCTVFYGSIPMTELSNIQDPELIISTQASNLLNATMVIGHPENIEKILNDQDIINTKRQNITEEFVNNELSEEAIEWLTLGERGCSSESMFQSILGVKLVSKISIPKDLDDFRRCCLLNDQVIEVRDNFFQMKNISNEWAVLVDKWDDLFKAMESDNPEWRNSLKNSPKFEKEFKKAQKEFKSNSNGLSP